MSVNVDEVIYARATTTTVDVHGNLKLIATDNGVDEVVAIIAFGSWKIVKVL